MMIEKRKYALGPDIDLDSEEVLEPDGTRLTEARAQELAEQTLRAVRGRPSLTGPGQRSPRVSFRLPADELRAAQQLAEREGVPVSELARRALEEFIRRAS
jgi:ribbon-helix-helix CopG family protein